MIVRERGSRPTWVPVPFIPAVSFEQTYFAKLKEAIAFAINHLSLTFPADVELGVLGVRDVTVAIDQDDMRTIRTDKITVRQTLSKDSDDAVNDALLEFFSQVYDGTGYARPDALFGFPPGPPQPPRIS